MTGASLAAAERGILRNRAFLAIWAAQILSQVAANAVTSALIILVAEITHSNTSSSFLILLAVLPAVLFGIAGGIIGQFELIYRGTRFAVSKETSLDLPALAAASR